MELGNDAEWDHLREGIEQIYLDMEHLTMSRYMILYSHAVNIICRIEPFDGTTGHHATRYDLYNYVHTFLLNHVTTLYNAANGLTTEDILRFYSSQWKHFKSSSKVLSHIIPFDNLRWPIKRWPEGAEKVYGMYQLSLVTWRDVLLSESGRMVRDGVLDLIEDERRGVPVSISLIRDVVFSYVELDLVEEEPTSDLQVYKSAFEGPFLENTKRFYKRFQVELFEQNPVSEYVKKIEQRLVDEEQRAEMYLHASTLEPLVRTLWGVLIEKHTELFYAEFKNLLSADRRDELANVCRLMSRTRDAMSHLATVFEVHVWAEGLSAVERVCAMASKDPMLYVDTLMQVYRKYNDIVLTAFTNDVRFVLSFGKACSKFINNNAVTLLAQSSRKTPECFAFYCDTILRRSSKPPQGFQLDDSLDGVIAMLEYVDDKDVFQKCSTQMLAKRLLQQLSVSEDMEASLVHKLGTTRGYGYVWTLQRLFRDVAASKEVNDQFMAHVKNTNERFTSDLSIHVLSSGLWPFTPSSELKLPQELELIVQSFETFYSGLHSTRKLQWLPNVSKVELVANCFEKGYTLESSTFQVAVLLQYNHGLSFTVQQLHEGTGIDMGVLQQVLQSLLNSNLLICPGQKTEHCKLRPVAVVSLFEGYGNKKPRVNINAPLNDELEAQRILTQKMLDDDRKLLVQAAIVRTMKVHKTLKDEELFAETVSQLKAMFKPTATLIKECISSLIEKEYLERDSGQLNTYNYLA